MFIINLITNPQINSHTIIQRKYIPGEAACPKVKSTSAFNLGIFVTKSKIKTTT